MLPGAELVPSSCDHDGLAESSLTMLHDNFHNQHVLYFIILLQIHDAKNVAADFMSPLVLVVLCHAKPW